MKKCYLCGSTSHRVRPGAVRDDNRLKVLECNHCQLVFLSSFKHIQLGHYEESGMHGKQPIPVQRWLNETEIDDERRYRFLQARLADNSVLDFGCGAGGFLLKARKTARVAEGVEPERRLQDHFSKLGLNVWTSIDAALASDKRYNLVTAFHVVEHLPDPKNTLQQLITLLNERGELVIEVPNADDALLTLYANEPFARFTYWSQHLYLFNPRTLANLIQQTGLKLRWLKQVQRYPLANHLHWLARGQPRGQQKWDFLDSPALKEAYSAQLAALGQCDTLLAGIGKD